MYSESERSVMETRKLFSYRPVLLENNGNYQKFMGRVHEGFSASNIWHEYHIIRQMREDVGNPLAYEPYAEVFGIGNGGKRARLLLSTWLGVPKGADPEEYVKIGGRKYWKRVLDPYLSETGILPEKVLSIPETGVVCEFDGTGVPSATESSCKTEYPYVVSFEFDPSVSEVALAIKGSDGYDKGLTIDATQNGRHKSKHNAIRLVRI